MNYKILFDDNPRNFKRETVSNKESVAEIATITCINNFSRLLKIFILLVMMSPFYLLGQTSNIAPNYPAIIKTGNSATDEENWKTALENWKINYPDEYKALESVKIGNPSHGGEGPIANTTGRPSPVSPDDNVYYPQIDINNSDYYKLKSIDAIDFNSNYSKEEVDYYKAEAKIEFYKKNIVVDIENLMWYEVPIDKKSETIIRQINFKDNTLINTDCSSCNNITFILLENTSSSIVLKIKSKEDAEDFYYQFNFKK